MRNFIAVLHGMDLSSAEQRKRITISIALVANPSIFSRDEPTIGLDTRVAAFLMLTVRNTIDTRSPAEATLPRVDS